VKILKIIRFCTRCGYSYVHVSRHVLALAEHSRKIGRVARSDKERSSADNLPQWMSDAGTQRDDRKHLLKNVRESSG
jgi:hypothetical protein